MEGARSLLPPSGRINSLLNRLLPFAQGRRWRLISSVAGQEQSPSLSLSRSFWWFATQCPKPFAGHITIPSFFFFSFFFFPLSLSLSLGHSSSSSGLCGSRLSPDSESSLIFLLLLHLLLRFSVNSLHRPSSSSPGTVPGSSSIWPLPTQPASASWYSRCRPVCRQLA